MKNSKTNITYENEVIGRVKVPLVSIEGPAIISTIIAKELEFYESKRILFKGVVPIDEKLKEHIRDIILPQVDNICNKLGISLCSFELSINNVGAISSSDNHYSLSGYSADTAIFVILLSVALKLYINQNIVFTGHISSSSGDISQVSNLLEKSEAALNDKIAEKFIYPEIESENSMSILKPKEYDRIRSYFRGLRGLIELFPVNNLYDVIKKTISEESIVKSSFDKNYFRHETKNLEENSLDISVYLKKNNDERFWKSIENNLSHKQIRKGQTLIAKYATYFIKEKIYPDLFGSKLNNLVLSLPLTTIKSEGFYPIIEKDIYIKLIQYAKKSDYQDVAILHKLTFDKRIQKKINKDYYQPNSGKTIQSDIVDFVLERLNPRFINKHVESKIDSARSKYILDRNSVDSYEELIDAISTYYQHILRQINADFIITSREKLQILSDDIFNKTYRIKNEKLEAISNGIKEFNGGLRIILDDITIHMKQTEKEKYVKATINDLVDPLNYEMKESIINEIFKRESKRLSLSEDDFESAKHVDNYIEIITQYAISSNKIQDIFERI